MKKTKTISGAMHSIPNLEHNSRKHQPENADITKKWANHTYVDGVDGISLARLYEKLFDVDYRRWREIQIRKGRGDRCPPTYLEKIQADKQKNSIYEIIFQVGDMMDTGYTKAIEDAKMAELLLDHFAHHLLSLPDVCVVTKEDLENPDWKPPFENGLIVQNFIMHKDESTPHMHFTYIPYSRTCRRGPKTQNAFSEAFRGMGYFTKQEQAIDKEGHPVWQIDENGEKIPQMKRFSFGGVEWVEEQKAWLAKEMKTIDWDRLHKGKNPRGNLMLSDYRREQAEIHAKEAEKELIDTKERLESEKRSLTQTSKLAMQEENHLSNIQKVLFQKEEFLRDIETKLTDKKNNLTVLSEKVEIAEKVYETFIVTNTAKQDMVEEIVELRYNNQKLREENTGLRQKLKQAYDFIKQFTIEGINLWEKFTQYVKHTIQVFSERGR